MLLSNNPSGSLSAPGTLEFDVQADSPISNGQIINVGNGGAGAFFPSSGSSTFNNNRVGFQWNMLQAEFDALGDTSLVFTFEVPECPLPAQSLEILMVQPAEEDSDDPE